MTTRLISAGAQKSWIAFVSNDKNIITGGTTTAPIAGAVSHGIPLIGVQTVPTGIPEEEVVSVLGDDDVLGSFQFDSTTPTTFIVNTGEQDLLKDALLQDTLVETIGNISVGAIRPLGQTLPDVMFIAQGRAKDTGANGAGGFVAYLYPRCTIKPLGRESFEGRAPASFRYQVVAQPANNKPTGTTFTNTLNGFEQTNVMELKTNYPIAPVRITGDNSTLTFTLDKTPSTVAGDSIVAVNAVQQPTSAYSFSASNKTITFAVAPASGVPVVVLYGYTD